LRLVRFVEMSYTRVRGPRPLMARVRRMENDMRQSWLAIILLMSLCPVTQSSQELNHCSLSQNSNWPISKEWLRKAVSVEEAEQMKIYCTLEKYQQDQEWKTLKATALKGDQIWYFSTIQKQWQRQGFVLIRDCNIVAIVETNEMLRFC
jgi:hypothetical protein